MDLIKWYLSMRHFQEAARHGEFSSVQQSRLYDREQDGECAYLWWQVQLLVLTHSLVKEEFGFFTIWFIFLMESIFSLLQPCLDCQHCIQQLSPIMYLGHIFIKLSLNLVVKFSFVLMHMWCEFMKRGNLHSMEPRILETVSVVGVTEDLNIEKLCELNGCDIFETLP